MQVVSQIVATKNSTLGKARAAADPRGRKDSPLYQPRIKQPLQQLGTQGGNIPLTETTISFDIQDQNFQQQSTNVKLIQARLESRKPSSDEQTQLAVLAADGDAKMALEAAHYFQNRAVEASNYMNQLVTTLDDTRHELQTNKEQLLHTLNQLTDLDKEIRLNDDTDLLTAQINRIKTIVKESQLLATELGYPIPQIPEILDQINPTIFENIEDSMVFVDGSHRSLQSVAFSLLLAEQQVIRAHNFLMKQTISDTQRLKAKTSQAENLQSSNSQSQQVACSQSQKEDSAMVQDLLTIAQSKTTSLDIKQAHNPVEVYQKEFGGSGVAVARQLIQLRDRVASEMLREQRFNADNLLKREASDDNSLRAQIVGLQNELDHSRRALGECLQIGLGFDLNQQNENCPNFSAEIVAQLSECALNQFVDLDLLPMNLAKSVDECIAASIQSAKDVVEGRIQAQGGIISVTQLQNLIEIRNLSMKKMQRVSEDLKDFLSQSPKLLGDVEADLVQFVKKLGNYSGKEQEKPKPSKDESESESESAPSVQTTKQVVGQAQTSVVDHFAQSALDDGLVRSRDFNQLILSLKQEMKEVVMALEKGNEERFGVDGSGYIDILEKLARTLEHTREMHHVVSQRDFAIARLQKIIVEQQNNYNISKHQLIQMAGVRNGILKAYVELQSKYSLLKENNQTIKLSAHNPVQLALDNCASTGNKELAEAMAAVSTDYTQAVKQLGSVIKGQTLSFQAKLLDTIDATNKAVNFYKDTVESRSQKAVQTERVRKVRDAGIMVVPVEQVDDKKKKK